MTRKELISAINENKDSWSCPEYSCDMPKLENNSGEYCLKCAEKQLKSYEDKIRADAIEEFCNGIEIDKPMHFTKEQIAWIKKYVTLKRHDAIDEIYKFIKAEGNPYGKPSIDYEETLKILRFLKQLKGEQNG